MNVTIILPLHKYSEEYDEMLKTSAGSINYTGKDKEVALIVVARKADYEKYKNLNKKSVTLVEIGEEETTNFQHMVNKGVEAVKTEYFAVLEVDDLFTEKAFVNFEKYANSEYRASIMPFLSEAVDYSVKDKGSIGYINEAAWANGFSEEIGTIDSNSIMDFFSFNLTGAIINKEDFLSVGGLKESIKISFWYEFLLRALKYGKNTFVIPKVGYIHMINRPDSLADEYSKTISSDEAEWWIDLAKKEYFYKEDRNKTYEE